MKAGRRLLAAVLAGGCLLILGLLTGGVPASRAQSLVADLSSHLIAISTGFTGTEVVLFGAVEGPGDVAVVVTGPRNVVTVRRKQRTAGLWINRDRLRLDQVPGFYVVAVSRPLDELVETPVLERHEIGLAHLHLTPTDPVSPRELSRYRAALIRNKQKDGLYGVGFGQVAFLGERLFRTNVYFPANVPTGVYSVSVFLIRDGEVVNAQTTPLIVSKVGFSAEIYEFAQQQSVLYGITAVIAAVIAGWLAGAIFRKA